MSDPVKLSISGVILASPPSAWSRDDGPYVLSGDIRAALAKASGPVAVDINSPGGDIFAAYDIVASLERYCAVKGNSLAVTVTSMAASAAAVIVLLLPSGPSCRKSMYPHAQLMFHGATVCAEDCGAGTLKDLSRNLDNINLVCINALSARMGAPVAAVAEFFQPKRELWMTAADALRYGIVASLEAGPDPAPALDFSPRILSLLKSKGDLTMAEDAKKPAEPQCAAPEPKKEPLCAAEPKKEPQCAAPEKPEPGLPGAPATETPPAPPAEPAAAPAEPEKPGEPDWKKEVDDLRAQLKAMQEKYDQQAAVAAKLTTGLRAPSTMGGVVSFGRCVAEYRKEHPACTYDDAFCACSKTHPDLYRAFRG